jgi:ubiquinone/menaquinone biosynthesis C-methylase UbiE
MIETATTSATYDQIAADYAARWASAEVLASARSRFAARLVAGARVLDVGCGPGWDALRLRALGLRVSGLDRSRGMLAQARQRGDLPLVFADMRQLPVRDAALDGIWACASFLHIPKRAALDVLREFHRALRPGGALYIGVKRGTSERWVEHSGGRQRFFAFYQENELDLLLASAGFAICEGWIGDDMLGREPWINRLALQLDNGGTNGD